MQSWAKRGRMVLALLGILAGMFSVFIGSLIFLFSIPSLGRQGEYGYLLSPAAGAILFCMLGLAGIMGASLAAESRRAALGSMSLLAFLSLTSLVVLAFFREWPACVLLILIVLVSWAGIRAKKGVNLLLYAGLVGFPIGQMAMAFLPYGWKTWSISGVLFVFSGIAFYVIGHFKRLPLLNSDGTSKRHGYVLYSLASFLLILTSTAILIHVPAGAGFHEGLAEDLQSESGSQNFASQQVQGMGACDCTDGQLESTPFASFGIQESKMEVRILEPGDVRTFPRGEAISFQADACGKGPFSYIWRSSLDGVISRTEKFNCSNLSVGWHNITLTISDSNNISVSDTIELGIAEPWVCGNANPRPKYYPSDTACQDAWPNATSQCQEFEVCHPELDYIVADAIYACRNYSGDKKRCRALYLIQAFGPEAKYMQGYALFKACCSGYPECTRTCGLGLAGICAFREGFNENVMNISCRPEEWGLEAWRSDRNMKENSAVLGMFPTHATVNILQTGVCIDYAAALTTLLRKAGYNRTEAFSTASTGYDLPLLGNHPGHAYNLVLLPGDSKYHFVDTTGNGEGINLDGVPHYFWFTGCFLGQPVRIKVFDWWVRYCNKTDGISYNDAGDFGTPKEEKICGCS